MPFRIPQVPQTCSIGARGARYLALFAEGKPLLPFSESSSPDSPSSEVAGLNILQLSLRVARGFFSGPGGPKTLPIDMELTEEEIRELEAFDDEEFDEGDGGTEVVYYRGGDSDEEDEEEGDEDEEEDGEYEDEEEVEVEEEVVPVKKGRPVEVYDDEEEEEKAKRSGARNDPEWQFFDTARIYVKGGDGGTCSFLVLA